MSVRLLIICLGMNLILGGCAPNRILDQDIRPIHFSANENYHARVRGLEDGLKANAGPVKVITLHGMIAHDPGFSDGWQKELAEKRLNMQAVGSTVRIEIERGYAPAVYLGQQPLIENIPRSVLRRSVWRKEGKLVAFYELTWSIPRDTVKHIMIQCFEAGNPPGCPQELRALPNSDRQHLLNGLLKSGIMITGFSDATIVASPFADVIRDDLALASCIMANDRNGEDALLSEERFIEYSHKRCAKITIDPKEYFSAGQRYFAITHSLGSFFLIDAIRYHQSTREGLSTVLPDMLDQGTIFLLANQVPLLTLARMSAVCGVEAHCPNSRLKTVEQLGRDVDYSGTLTTVVAFNDRDDILGFDLPPYLASADSQRNINVSVRNPAFSIPWLLKDPAGAHLGNQTNPAILDFIAYGREVGHDVTAAKSKPATTTAGPKR